MKKIAILIISVLGSFTVFAESIQIPPPGQLLPGQGTLPLGISEVASEPKTPTPPTARIQNRIIPSCADFKLLGPAQYSISKAESSIALKVNKPKCITMVSSQDSWIDVSREANGLRISIEENKGEPRQTYISLVVPGQKDKNVLVVQAN